MVSRRCFLMSGTALLAPSWPHSSKADAGELRLAVVVGKSSPLSELSVQDLKNLYRGDQLTGPGGKRLLPFALSPGLPERVGFDRVVLGWSPAEVGGYWIDRRIRGQSGPPRSVDSPELLLRVVAKLEGAVGYVRAADVRDYAKVLRIDGKLPSEPGYPISF
jgi:hypothetical protein